MYSSPTWHRLHETENTYVKQQAAVIVEVFAHRPLVQERLTEQVAQAIEDVLKPRGVGVVIKAVHICMMMCGVEKQNSRTITSALRGQFRECPMTRVEFFRLAHQSASG